MVLAIHFCRYDVCVHIKTAYAMSSDNVSVPRPGSQKFGMQDNSVVFSAGPWAYIHEMNHSALLLKIINMFPTPQKLEP